MSGDLTKDSSKEFLERIESNQRRYILIVVLTTSVVLASTLIGLSAYGITTLAIGLMKTNAGQPTRTISIQPTKTTITTVGNKVEYAFLRIYI